MGKSKFGLRHILLLGAGFGGGISHAVAPPAYAQEATRAYQIGPQDLDDALREFARQTGRDVLFTPATVAGKRSPGAEGRLTERQALEALLAGSGLRFEQTASNGYAVQDPNSPTRLGDARRDDAAPSEGNVDEEIVVVGTNIRGVYPESSPVDIYTAEDIARTGATTTEQFIQKLPQNFATRGQYAGGAQASARWNQDAINGVDLRGLGVGTSLVLVNGRRLGLSDVGRTADVSVIPASAIARVEVLTDGASAIYGSDAIGGVVNFVLRDDFEGAETRLSYGGVTSGNLRQGDFTQTFGRQWRGGHGLVSYNYFSASALEVSDRDYASAVDRGALTPHDARHNLLATFSQDMTDRLQLSGDFVYAQRDVKTENNFIGATPVSNTLNVYTSETTQYFANLALNYEIADALNASVRATYSDVDTSATAINVGYNRAPPTAQTFLADKNHTALDVTAMLDGRLLTLPGGAVRFSLGGGFRTEDYFGVSAGGVPVRAELGREVTYAFGELFVPLVGEDQEIPLVRRLELSLAGRYTRYEDASTPALNYDFGAGTDPKVGLLWAPFDSLSLRGTYGTSFRAPSLVELDPGGNRVTLIAGTPIPFPSGPASVRLGLSGITPDIEPETAETITFGFDFRPSALPGLALSATYYSIDYEDRIGQAPTGGLGFIQTPALFPDAIFRAPSAAFVEDILRTQPVIFNNTGVNVSNPAAAAATLFGGSNFWVQDSRLKNLAISQQDGLDLSASYRFETSWGEIRLGASASRIFGYTQQASAGSAAASVTDIVSRPADLRGRVFFGISRGAFDGTVNVNYVDDYANTFVTPVQPVDSWTTTDLAFAYDFGAADHNRFDGLRLSFSVQNLFDQDPPRVSDDAAGQGIDNPVGFDPANANPLGRFVMIGLSKSW